MRPRTGGASGAPAQQGLGMRKKKTGLSAHVKQLTSSGPQHDVIHEGSFHDRLTHSLDKGTIPRSR